MAEINSTFKRTHRPSTFARWAETVPATFRFSVKLPKAITHDLRLVGAEAALETFLASLGPLGDRLGPLLVQLPPSLQFDAAIATPFFARLRQLSSTAIACEPRHPSWFTAPATGLLADHGVSRVIADPPPVAAATEPAGNPELLYLRLHGTPRMYYSSYDDAALAGAAIQLTSTAAAEAWCIFDNTASGAALVDALRLNAAIAARQ